MEKPCKIFGIDFSGAQDAGNKIWITRGLPTRDGLVVEDCLRARDLPNSGRRLEVCLPALVELVMSNQNAVFGFDFPFGLARSLIKEKTWAEWLLTFPSRFKNPDDFKKKCFSQAGYQELKRHTENEAHIHVNVKSLNHAYTKASLRLEPNRRSHGGRVYDHVAYKTDKGFIPLETIRNEFEEKMWNKLLNK
jgi:hypothetical protein